MGTIWSALTDFVSQMTDLTLYDPPAEIVTDEELLVWLESDVENETTITDVRRGTNGVTPALLHYLVWEYCEKHPVKYQHPGAGNKGFDMKESFDSWIKTYGPCQFDIYMRFPSDDMESLSRGRDSSVPTFGQMRFFYWATKYGVIDYAIRNIAAIQRCKSSNSSTGSLNDPCECVTNKK